MADRTGRPDAQKDRVAVAVVAELDDGERVAGRLALVPELLARAAPEPRLARLARAAERLLVHPGEHQHAAVVGVLDDRRGQIRTGHPASFSSRFSSGSRSGRSWTIDAISAASAPACERLGQVGGVAGAAGGDHGHGDGVGDGAGQLEVVAGAGAVGVDRREQDLAGAALDRLPRPLDRVETARVAPGVRDDLARRGRRSRRRPPGRRTRPRAR